MELKYILDQKTNFFMRYIIEWWENHRRNFSWRNTDDPYYLLITEILLRKTTAEQVKSVYPIFLKKYPTVKDLYQADKKDLEKILYHLGMEKKRSKELLIMSKQIFEEYDGQIPLKFDELIKLKGVGRYTANGVLCQSFKKDSPMVDTNVIRVIVRYFDYKSSKKRPRDDLNLWLFVDKMIPEGKCKEFNLGLIDFATEICKIKNPNCNSCKLWKFCTYYEKNFEDFF